MTIPSALNLAELLCARLCHDLSSPVGATAAGVELCEDGNGGVDAETLSMVAASAANAVTRLKFFRACLGPAASGQQTAAALRTMIDAYLSTQTNGAGDTYCLDWQVDPPQIQGMMARLLLNLVLLGKDCLPRGGQMRLRLQADLPSLELKGVGAGLGDEIAACLLDSAPPQTPKGAQARLLRDLVQTLDAKIAATISEHHIIIELQRQN